MAGSSSSSGRNVKSKYKYVSGITDGKNLRWYMCIDGCSRKRFINERDAAIAVDKFLISLGKEPVNILIRK